ncbi:uncharacterized protein LOC122625503 [Drosophila teissieri]|uniref:uncharacterized protein LOC122625503 n=1 Tax=Drosophila teissieri TaxID=7243 RepID=UPI001CB9FEBF|nr:uncharacterized protein LOC122625503 [Drosophila teissieri]
MPLRVLQLNFHKSKIASAELLFALEQGSVDIALVQEPWITSGNAVAGLKSSNYNLFYTPSVSRNRTAVLLWKGLHANLMSHYSTDDLTVVILEGERMRLLVASCYMAHDRTAPPKELRSMVEASPNDQQLIVGTDANAHHCVWGGTDINDRANVGEKHTFVGPTSSNVLDLTLVRGQSTMVSEWRVLERPSFSDHKNHRNTKSAEDIDKSLETLSRELLDAQRAACQDQTTLVERDYKKEIRRAQRSSWRNFCSNIKTAPETARLWKLLLKQPTIQSQDGQWTDGSEEALTALMHAHFQGCTEISDANKHQDLVTGEEHLPTDLISSRRIQWAIDSFAGIKAPGLDGIFPAMLQVTKEVITLHAIFTARLSTGYIPIQWRTSRIVFLPKGGKCSHMSPKDYRLISLTSFLLKTLEKLLDIYIRNDGGASNSDVWSLSVVAGYGKEDIQQAHGENPAAGTALHNRSAEVNPHESTQNYSWS